MPNFADWTPVDTLPPATAELHRRTRLLVLDGEPDRGFVCRKLDDGTYEWYEIVKEEPLATGGGHPDLADHDLLGLVTQTELTTHAADVTAVHGIADAANLVLTNDARLTDARTPTSHSITTLHSFPGGVLNFLREDGTFTLPIGLHPDLATHDALGLATDAELAAHAAAGNPHPAYATDTDLTTHAGAADPHTGYVQEAAVPGGELGGTYATPTVDAAHSGSTHAATQAAAEATAASALSTHAGATDPHTGYLKENDADWIDLTDGLSTALHSHSAAHPDLATHDTLGLATQAELDAHAAAGNPHAVYATDSDLTAHAGAADPHTGYLKENDANYVDLTDGGATTLHSHVGGSVNISETEVDFGNVVRLMEKSFVITDAGVSTSSQLLANVAHKSPSDSRSIDEIGCESFDIMCAPGTGNFTLTMRSRLGSVMGKFIISYLVG